MSARQQGLLRTPHAVPMDMAGGMQISTDVLVSHTFQRHVGRFETAIGPNTCALFNGHSGGGEPYSTKGRTLAGAHKMEKNESHPSSY